MREIRERIWELSGDGDSETQPSGNGHGQQGMGTARASRTVGEGQIYHDVVCFLAGLLRDNRRGDQMWLIAAILSSFFRLKLNIRPGQVRDQKIDSDIATALRTIVVLICSGLWFLSSTLWHNHADPAKVIAVLILSGGAAGASWPSLFRAILTGLLPCIVNINSRIRLRTESSRWITL